MEDFDRTYIRGGVGGDASFNTQLTTVLPKGAFGGPSGLRMQYAPPSAKGATTGAMSYRVYVPADFDPVLGGKLPGFNADEFCARVMFRRTNTKNAAQFGGEMYLHGPAQLDPGYTQVPGFVGNDDHGDSLYRYYFWFNKGQWNDVSYSITLNTPGSANGTLSLTVNGTTQTYSKYMFREHASTTIDCVLYTVFYGGSTSAYAPKKDETIILDRMKFSFKK